MPLESNRIFDAIILYIEQEIKYKVGNPLGSVNDQYSNELKSQYYRDILQHFKNKLSPSERTSRKYLKNEVRKLTVRVNPSFINRLLYGRLSRRLQNFVSGNLKAINLTSKSVQKFQNRIGIEYNTVQLDNSLKQAGFSQDIVPTLQKMISQGLSQFHIRYADIKNANTDFILHFKQIPGTAAYEFASVDVAKKPKWGLETKEEQMWYNFNQRSINSFNANELANLAAGRCVCKDERWYILDKDSPSDYLKTTKFDIITALQKLPLKKMSKTEFNNLVNTLKHGNSKEVTLIINDEAHNYFLCAAPQSEGIRILNDRNRVQDIDSIINRNKEQGEILEKLINHANEEVVNLDLDNSYKMKQ